MDLHDAEVQPLIVDLWAEDLSVDLDRTPILSGVGVRFESSHSVAITGRSGAGKTTLLHCLAGLRRPTRGRVLVDGRDLYSLSDRQRSRHRLESFGFVFQRSDLVAELTLRQNIALPLEMRGVRRSVVSARVDELVERLGLCESEGRRPARVSGGQRQRAAIARALVGRPSVVFADEPTGALDSENGQRVLDLLLAQAAEHGALLVTVTHDLGLAARFDRALVMADGRVVEDTGVRRLGDVV